MRVKRIGALMTILLITFMLYACGNDATNIESVETFEPLDVAQFTNFDDLSLPSEVDVTLENDEIVTLRVSWDDARGRYANNQVGTYQLTGDLITSGDIVNREGVNVNVSVNVFAEDALNTLKASQSFEIFVELIEAAELEETFADREALTIFAPNDEAINNLLGTLDTTLNELKESDVLEPLLLYHVIDGVRSKSAIEGFTPLTLTTLQGEDIGFTTSNNRLALNGNVFVNDLEYTASNGVIIGTDNVLLPSEVLSEVASGFIPEDLMDILFDLIASGDIPIDLLPLPGSGDFEAGFTLFLPTENAILNLADELDLSLERLVETDMFIEIITYHVILDAFLLSELYERSPTTIETFQGEFLSFEIIDDTLKVNDLEITGSERLLEFGYIHMIDGILIPPSFSDDLEDELE